MADVITVTQMISSRGDFSYETSGSNRTVWNMSDSDKYLVPADGRTTLWFTRIKTGGGKASVTIKTFLNVDGLDLPDRILEIVDSAGAVAPIAMLDETYINPQGYYEITCDKDAVIQLLPHQQEPL